MEPISSGDKEGKSEGRANDVFSDRAAQRKRLFSVILAVGLAAIVLGFFGILNNITSPFERTTNSQELSQQDAIDSLKGQDTDADGVNDYDEAFTYRTSLFVKDSDSDGKTDSQEIAAKTDPNCPEGKTCGRVAATNTNAAESNPQATAIRDALQKSGAPSYLLDQTDDATLLKLYREAVLGNANANVSISEGDLENLSASQIRQLLKANGVDQETLNALDDATLLQIYQDTLAIEQ